MLGLFNLLIRCSFYLLFFLVPLFFTGNTSELFEFNKIWLTYGLTLIVASAWIGKIFFERRIRIRKTPLDIPILLFLLSQLVSTIFSIDPHTSIWGYYSRFNGGLLSLLSYAFLYFAFVSNVKREDVLRFVYIGLASSTVVALWGLPSHFGYDPTCLVFRGTLDVSCWTFAFQPTVRIFSTLGQPDWMGAYMVYMLPLAICFTLIFWKQKKGGLAILFLLLVALFYTDLLYTRSRSSFLGMAVSVGLFVLVFISWQWRSFAKHPLLQAVKRQTGFLVTLGVLVVLTFIIGTPIDQLSSFSLAHIQTLLTQQKAVQKALQTTPPPPAPATSGIPVEEFGGTDSGKIRLFVWKGAWEVFLHNPLFGTGVETFGYSYYLFRPAGHNLTSEWDYLYNKAHNEYLNYLATTGIFGFGTYMVVVGYSIWLMLYGLWKTQNISEQEYKQKDNYLTRNALRYSLLALLSGYISILVTNFFGFSVVIINIYLFLTPAFALLLCLPLVPRKYFLIGNEAAPSGTISNATKVAIGIVWFVALYCIFVLIRFWLADVSYAYGQNLDHASQYQTAYSYLHDAVATRPSEPTFQDELAINDAVLATALFQQKDSVNGTRLTDEATTVSDSLVQNHPNVITYWKSRVRIFYTLAQHDPRYLATALTAIQKASVLAPTDAKVWYNLGLLYDQTGDVQGAIKALEQTVVLKADYRDAYYALALFYRQAAVGADNGKVVKDPSMEKKAVNEMHFILANFGPNDDLKIRDTLKSWGEQ